MKLFVALLPGLLSLAITALKSPRNFAVGSVDTRKEYDGDEYDGEVDEGEQPESESVGETDIDDDKQLVAEDDHQGVTFATQEDKGMSESDASPPAGAIVYTYQSGHFEEFKKSLASLCKHTHSMPHYPILVVTGSTMSKNEETTLSAYASSLEKTQNLHRKCSIEWVKSPGADLDSLYTQNHKQGTSFVQRDYGTMISFWTHDIMQLAKMRGLRYIMRLDTDSMINSDITEDLFMKMQEKSAVYGYRGFCYEGTGTFSPKKVVPSVRSFLAAEKVQAPADFLKELDQTRDALPIFYTNFEIIDVDFFSRADVLKLAKHMINLNSFTGDVMDNRIHLGDAVIRAYQVGIFADQERVLHLNEFEYGHGRGNKCFLDAQDGFDMAWGLDTHRHGTPTGHCCSRWSMGYVLGR